MVAAHLAQIGNVPGEHMWLGYRFQAESLEGVQDGLYPASL
jgi:hypothetical protein